jgi:hypothetical protein
MKQELSAIREYCNTLNWSCEVKGDGVLSTEVPGENGVIKTVWVVAGSEVVEISVQSGFAVDEDDDFPGIISTMMLNLNSKMDYGFWCLESLGGKQIASIMHNQAPEDLDKNTFRTIATKLVSACAGLETTMAANFVEP